MNLVFLCCQLENLDKENFSEGSINFNVKKVLTVSADWVMLLMNYSLTDVYSIGRGGNRC